jgi:hypothetical protein
MTEKYILAKIILLKNLLFEKLKSKEINISILKLVQIDLIEKD